MEEKFSEHLLEIGFIDSKTLFQLITLYNTKKDFNNNNNQFNKKMTEILLLFFDNITDIQKKFICFHLPAKFIKMVKLKIKRLLKNIIFIKELKNKILLIKYLFRWYKNKHIVSNDNYKEKIFDNNLKNKNIFKQQSHKFIKANGLKKKIISQENNTIFNNIREFIDKANNINTSLNSKNEMQENKFWNNNIINNKRTKKDKNSYNKTDLGNFNINLNNENINYLNNGKIKDKTKENIKKMFIDNNQISNLIQNFTIINHKIKNFDLINKDFIDSIESSENYISTNNNTTNRYLNTRKNKNFPNDLNAKTKNSNFNLFNTPNIAKTLNAKKILNIKPRNNNNIYNLIYCNNYNNLNNNIDFNLFTEKTPFCEREIKTIESNRNPRFSTCKRLYEQGIKKIKNKKNMKTPSPRKFSNPLEKQKTVNYKHIYSLYKNKKRNKTLEKVKNKVEKEEGLTFHPKLIKSNYTDRINSNFLERNYSSPKNEKKICEYNEGLNSCYSCKNKNMNKKDKEKIVNVMINRLYKNKKNDDNEDDSFFCKKYIIQEMKTSNYLKGYKKKI